MIMLVDVVDLECHHKSKSPEIRHRALKSLKSTITQPCGVIDKVNDMSLWYATTSSIMKQHSCVVGTIVLSNHTCVNVDWLHIKCVFLSQTWCSLRGSGPTITLTRMSAYQESLILMFIPGKIFCLSFYTHTFVVLFKTISRLQFSCHFSAELSEHSPNICLLAQMHIFQVVLNVLWYYVYTFFFLLTQIYSMPFWF